MMPAFSFGNKFYLLKSLIMFYSIGKAHAITRLNSTDDVNLEETKSDQTINMEQGNFTEDHKIGLLTV